MVSLTPHSSARLDALRHRGRAANRHGGLLHRYRLAARTGRRSVQGAVDRLHEQGVEGSVLIGPQTSAADCASRPAPRPEVLLDLLDHGGVAGVAGPGPAADRDAPAGDGRSDDGTEPLVGKTARMRRTPADARLGFLEAVSIGQQVELPTP